MQSNNVVPFWHFAAHISQTIFSTEIIDDFVEILLLLQPHTHTDTHLISTPSCNQLLIYLVGYFAIPPKTSPSIHPPVAVCQLGVLFCYVAVVVTVVAVAAVRRQIVFIASASVPFQQQTDNYNAPKRLSFFSMCSIQRAAISVCS